MEQIEYILQHIECDSSREHARVDLDDLGRDKSKSDTFDTLQSLEHPSSTQIESGRLIHSYQ